MNKKRELSPYEKIVRERIIDLINKNCNGKQSKFVERTGLNKGSVSQYVNGNNTPSWDNAQKIAAAFDIDASWVMENVKDIPPHELASYRVDPNTMYTHEFFKNIL